MPTTALDLLNDPSHGLTVLTTPDGEYRILAPKLAEKLGYPRTARLLQQVQDDEKGVMEVPTPVGPRATSYLTLSGMFRAMGTRPISRIADPDVRTLVDNFQNWIYREVLPSLAREGFYLTESYREEIGTVAGMLYDNIKSLRAKLRAKDTSTAEQSLNFLEGNILHQYLIPMAGEDTMRRLSGMPPAPVTPLPEVGVVRPASFYQQ